MDTLRSPGPTSGPSSGQALGLLLGSVAGDGDPRVLAVLEVLGGDSPREVAARWAVEPTHLHCWTREFVEAGAAAVTNRPRADAARQRDRFLVAFAHELRTPLAVATGWTMMMAEGELEPWEYAETAGRLQAALQRLTDRTHDLEQLAAASLGRLEMSFREVPLGRAVAHVPGLPPLHGGSGDLTVRVDVERFALLLRDVWNAAAQGLSPPAARHLEAASVPPWVELRVVRTGKPLSPPVLRALFDPFDLNADDTGVTMGLHLARALTVAHGGTLGLEQEDDRTVFWVRLPEAGGQVHVPELRTTASSPELSLGPASSLPPCG